MTAAELDLLFPTTPRWGWELRLPAPARPSPERDHPPVPPPGRRLSADGARKVLVIASVSVVVGFAGYAADLALEASLGAKHVDPQELIVGAICSPLTIWAIAVWRRARVDTVRGKSAVSFLSLLLFFTCILTSLVLAGEGLVLLVCAVTARRRGTAAEDQWREWQRRVVEFETSEQRRVDSADLWYPVSPSPAADLVGVFGGTAVGWMVLLATFGSSLVSRGPLVVVDLTRRRSTRLLVDLANLRGISPRTIAAPSGMAVADLFAGWTWEALTSLVVEALHANEDDPAMSRRERQEDRGVLRDVAACFDRARAVSFARLLAGLQVVNKERRAPSSDDIITMDEYERLSDLYGEVQRSHGGVLERATRLERVIRDLDVIDGNKASGPTDVTPNADFLPDGMTVFRIDDHIEELDSEFLVDVLFQLLLRQVRVGQSRPGTLLVLGADRVRRQALENLTDYCTREGIPAFLFFEHFRGDAVDVIGGGGAAAAFLALPNHRQAQEAVAFIGSDHRWVESQHTRGVNTTVTNTWGSSTGYTDGGMSSSSNVSESFSHALGKTEEYSTTEQRVFEPLVEPNVIMGLPATGMIYVEVQPGGQRRIANVDFNPQIAFSPRVSQRPFELAATTSTERWTSTAVAQA